MPFVISRISEIAIFSSYASQPGDKNRKYRWLHKSLGICGAQVLITVGVKLEWSGLEWSTLESKPQMMEVKPGGEHLERRSQGLELLLFGIYMIYMIKPIKCLQNPRIEVLICCHFNRKHITALKQWINFMCPLWIQRTVPKLPDSPCFCPSSSKKKKSG